MWGATNQPNPTCRQHSDNRKSLKKTCDANNFGMAAKILILKKVLRNNPTFRNFLWKNIGGLLWWPPTPPPPGGKKFWNFFHPTLDQIKKIVFAFYSIFCFALLLPQILVNFQNQGQIWNRLFYDTFPRVEFSRIAESSTIYKWK